MPNQELRYTHVSNFYRNALALMDESGSVHESNLGEDGADSGKKSHSESGNAALAILIMIIKLEADLRSRYDAISERSDADSIINPVELMKNTATSVNSNIDTALLNTYGNYMFELLLVRNIIAHGYIYEGNMLFDDEWAITSLTGSNVTGRDRSKIGEDGRTKLLKIETSPYKMCVFHAITVYRTIEVIREMTNMTLSTENIQHRGEYITMREWLEMATGGIIPERNEINSRLHDDYYVVMASLSDF